MVSLDSIRSLNYSLQSNLGLTEHMLVERITFP